MKKKIKNQFLVYCFFGTIGGFLEIFLFYFLYNFIKFPLIVSNVMAFLEDKENVDLSYEDQNAINEILKLQRELNDIEIKESFKLGFKEALIFLESMDMLYYKN